MDFNIPELEEQGQQDQHAPMKIKLLDKLIDDIQMLDDGPNVSEESPLAEESEGPGIKIKETVVGAEDPSELEEKLKGL